MTTTTTKPSTAARLPAVEFNTTEYQFSHGRMPRGYGSWAFEIPHHGLWWAPSSTYTDAKRALRRHLAEIAPVAASGMIVKVAP